MSDKQVMLYVGGSKKSYRCICGCNVFTVIGEKKYRCNSCKSESCGDDSDKEVNENLGHEEGEKARRLDFASIEKKIMDYYSKGNPLLIHSRALAAHCECLAMNAENCMAANIGNQIPYTDMHYFKVMEKWKLINEKGEPLI